MGLADKKGNKGEWAEVYVFLHLLGVGRLHTADKDLRKKADAYVDVIGIIRSEIRNQISRYMRNSDEGTIELQVDGSYIGQFLISDFEYYASVLFDHLTTMRGKSFGPPQEFATFSDTIGLNQIKSPPTRNLGDFGGKTDIVVKIRDNKRSLVSTLGFSIKSHFGGRPTLYNAGNSTQFVYRLDGVTDEQMVEFNSISGNGSQKAMSKYFNDHDWSAFFVGTRNPQTHNNLVMIRDSMPDLFAWILRRALLEDYPQSCSFKTLLEGLQDEDPMNYPTPLLYTKALKDLLFATFAGMTGANPWDGKEEVNGGYIVVLPDGDVVCFHTSDREDFRDYLLHSTHIEYVSKSKFTWGRIYKEGDKYMIDLNASIRFKPIPKKSIQA